MGAHIYPRKSNAWRSIIVIYMEFFLERVQPETIAHIVCMHIYLFKKKQEEEREIEIISDSFIKLVANRSQQ